MDLKKLNDEDLLKRTRTLAENDRKLTVEILWHLAEIDSRRLYAERAYPSLHEYCIHELKFSAGTAARRISVMRILRELPTLEVKIRAGELNLTNISLAAQFFRESKKNKSREYSSIEKANIIESLERKSFRDAEKFLTGLSPRDVRIEKKRVIDMSRTELTIQIDDELYEKLEFIKANCVHQLNGSVKYADILRLLADKMIGEIEKKRGRAFVYLGEQIDFAC